MVKTRSNRRMSSIMKIASYLFIGVTCANLLAYQRHIQKSTITKTVVKYNNDNMNNINLNRIAAVTQTNANITDSVTADTNDKGEAICREECKLDVTKIHSNKASSNPQLYKTKPQKDLTHCLFFRCSSDVDLCDNNAQTNYDGPDLPCCAHILRDAGKLFDEFMCKHGLDYWAAFGTLLGIQRSDRFIPWTLDSDYVLPSLSIANTFTTLWDDEITKETGMKHLYHSQVSGS